MSINPILSWKKDKFDKRDYLHKYMIQPVSIPTAFTLSSFCPSVRDQGNIGSCTGFGIGGSLTGLAKQKKLYTQWFSPNWGSSTITTQKMIRIQQSTDGGTTWTDVYKNNSLFV